VTLVLGFACVFLHLVVVIIPVGWHALWTLFADLNKVSIS